MGELVRDLRGIYEKSRTTMGELVHYMTGKLEFSRIFLRRALSSSLHTESPPPPTPKYIYVILSQKKAYKSDMIQTSNNKQ